MGRKIIDRLKIYSPPLIWSCFFAIIIAAATLTLLNTGTIEMIPEEFLYLIYVVAFIALSNSILSIILFYKTGKPKEVIIDMIHKTAFTAHLYDDYSYRTLIFAAFSFFVNVLLAVAKGAVGIVTASYWLIAFAVYYIVLCIMKMVLLSGSRNINKKVVPENRMITEWKAYRLSGILLLFLTIVLQGVVLLIIKKGNGFRYDGILIFVVAIYDFVCLISSCFYITRNRRKHSPIVVAIKIISFTTSLVAMLSLQTAMFATFGNEAEKKSQSMMNIATGTGVCLIVLLLSIYMIINANRKIRNSITIEE